MKKDKIVITITVGIACLVLVMIMFMQFKVVDQTNLTSIETMTESELRSELVDIREKYEQLTLQHSEALVKLKQYKEEYKTDEETKELLEKELNQLKILLGTTTVEGQGIVITIGEDDADKLENDRINYEDLLIIINSLKSAGADAISINGQRIITTTDIFDINSLYTTVNGEKISAPYEIKVIGNQTYLESSLLGKGGYLDELQSYGFNISIERMNNITINAYSGQISTKYMK